MSKPTAIAEDETQTACLVCRSRKVRCDRALPSCGNCTRLGVRCPGYDDDDGNMPRSQMLRSVQAIYSASGVEKRRFGSCDECRTSKNRCTRSKPSCRRCTSRGLSCVYPSPGTRVFTNKPSGAGPSSDTDTPSEEGRPHQKETQPGQPSVPLRPQLGHVTFSGSHAHAPVPVDQLHSEELPEDLALRFRLVMTYFERIHPLKCFSFIHKPSFLHSLDRGSVIQDYSEPLLYIICALAARTIYVDSLHSTPSAGAYTNATPGDAWAEKARREVLVELHVPTIQHLMTIVLLCEYALRTDQNALAYVLSGSAYRVLQLLRLDIPQHSRLTSDASPSGPLTGALQQEVENRLVWACYALDVLIASGVDANSSWHNRLPNVPLPCSDKAFLAQAPGPSPTLREVLPQSGNPASVYELELPALLVVLIRLRSQVLRLIRTQQPHDTRIWDSASPFMKIIDQLDAFNNDLSDQYRLTDLNVYIHRDQHLVGAVLCLHLLYHAAVFDLTRISLAGFSFPLAAAFRDAPPDFRTQCQKRCLFHANEVSGLVRKGLAHGGPTAFDDTFCSDAVLESTKIQIIYSATVDNDEQTLAVTRHNLRSNLQVLKSLQVGKAGSNPYICLAQALCMVFGFRDIVEEWWDSQTEIDAPSVEVNGSAEMDHLSTFAPFRKAMSELKARKAGPGPGPGTISTSSDTRSSPRSQLFARAQPPIIAATCSPQETDSQGYAASFAGAEYDELQSQTQQQPSLSTAVTGVSGDEQPGQQLFDNNLDALMRLAEPSLEDYMRTADELGTYITWDASELSGMPF